VFSAAAAFTEKHHCHVFGYGLNINYCLWDPWTYVVKPQDNQKQLEVAFLCWVANCVYKHIKQRRGRRRIEIEHSGEQLSQLTTGFRHFHRQPLLFPFSFSFSFYILYCSRCMWTVESSSSPAFVVFTASHCSSSSPSPLSSAFFTAHVNSREWINLLFTIHFACEQWRAAHRWSPSFPSSTATLSLPFLLLLRLLHSPLFTWTMENASTVMAEPCPVQT